MYKIILNIFLLVVAISVAHAQNYAVKSVKFQNNEEALKYFESVDSKYVGRYSEFYQRMLINELSEMQFDLNRSDESLELVAYRGSTSTIDTLIKTNTNNYRKDIKGKSYLVKYDSGEPLLELEYYVTLKESEIDEVALDKLVEKESKRIKLYSAVINLGKSTKENSFSSINRVYKVISVLLRTDEKVLKFAEEYVNLDLYTKNYKYSQKELENIFLGMEYEIKTDGRIANIRAGAISFSSNLQKVEENIFRAEVMNVFYDFVINPTSQKQFDVISVEYTEFFTAKNKYSSTKEYISLEKKHGNKIPLFTIVTEVVEVNEENH